MDPSVIHSPRHPLALAVAGLHDRAQRRAAHLVLAEGPHLLVEGLQAGWDLVTCLYTPDWADGEGNARLLVRARGQACPVAPAGWPRPGLVAAVSDRVMMRMASTDTPQGVLSVFAVRPVAPEVAGGSVLVLDRLQDPGNVGALARTALAFCGPDLRLLCDRLGADPYGPKVLRASAGAVFRLGITESADLPGEVARLGQAGVHFWALVPDGGQPLSRELVRPGPFGLIVGNEGAGIAPDLQALGTPVSIPVRGPVESLNAAVAGAIALFALTQWMARM